jgi:hypothetical protein
MNVELISSLLGNLRGILSPPGTQSDFIDHPAGRTDRAVEIAVVMQHRFAFQYWLKWHGKETSEVWKRPNLLTIDWHDDVGADSDVDPDKLRTLNPRDENELAMFCWAGLCSLNDGQILPAVYLDAVSEVYVILKQHTQRGEDRADRTFIDKNGNPHNILYYPTAEEFLRHHRDDAEWPLILDLDLDYFTEHEGDAPDENDLDPLVPNGKIRRVLSPRGSQSLMQWVFPRMAGFTIALEPEFCGGIYNCMHILDVLSRTLFDPPLLHPAMKWRHLHESKPAKRGRRR